MGEMLPAMMQTLMKQRANEKYAQRKHVQDGQMAFVSNEL
jgi:hypothetical protein